jgi:hypothetical protein
MPGPQESIFGPEPKSSDAATVPDSETRPMTISSNTTPCAVKSASRVIANPVDGPKISFPTWTSVDTLLDTRASVALTRSDLVDELGLRRRKLESKIEFQLVARSGQPPFHLFRMGRVKVNKHSQRMDLSDCQRYCCT